MRKPRVVSKVVVRHVVRRFQRGAGSYLKPTPAERAEQRADDERFESIEAEERRIRPPDPDLGVEGYVPLDPALNEAANAAMWKKV